MGRSKVSERREAAAQRATRALQALGIAAIVLVPLGAAQAQAPTPNFQWNNFISAGTQWANANNWIPAGPPPSSIDQILGFGSSPLQTVTGYTTTNASGNFNVNSLVFTANSNSQGGITLTNTLATDAVVFNTDSLATLPSVWQMGTGRVSIRHAVAGTGGIVLAGGAGGTTLRIRGTGIGDTYLDTSIVQTGAASGLQINQTGTRPFFTGSVTRLGGSASTFTGGVDLTAGNLMLGNVLGTTGAFNPTTAVAATPVNALGTGTLTINGGSLQFDPTAISSGVSPTGATGTLQVNNAVVLNSALNLTGVAPATAPSGSIVGIFAGNISGVGGINVVPTNGTVNFGFTGNNTFSGPLNIAAVGNTVSTLLIGTANVSTGNLAGTTAITITGNSSMTLNNVFGAATRLNTTTAPSLTLNRGNFNLFGNPTTSVAETLGVLTVNGTGSIQALAGSSTVGTASLTFASLNRGPDNKGTLSLTGTALGSGTGNGEGIISFTANPGGALGGGGGAGTTNRDILPYAVVNSQVLFAGISGTLSTAGTTLNGNFVTSQAANLGLARWDAGTLRIAPLAGTEYATNLYTTGTTAPTANMRLQSTSATPNAFSAAKINKPTTVNALVLDTNIVGSTVVPIGVSVGGTGTLTVGSGTILNGTGGNSLTITTVTHPNLINLGGLDFGANTGYLQTVTNLMINAPISGSAGLVKSQFGTAILNGNSTFTGGLWLNGGPVQFSTDSNLGAAGEGLTFNSGLSTGLSYLPSNLFASTAAGSLTVNRPITVGASGGIINVGLTGSNLSLTNAISGTGQLFKAGAGILTLAGVNTYTGNTAGNAGILAVRNDSNLGAASSSVVLAGMTFQPLTSFSTSRDFLQTATSTIFTNGSNLTLDGNLTNQQQPSATQTLFKVGLGDLILTNANTFNQSFQLGESTPLVRASAPSGAQTAGRLILSGANGSINQSASVFAIGGGEIILDNSVSANSNRLPNATLSLIGGGLTLIGNVGTPINEQIGALSINNANNQYGGRLTIDSPAGAGATTLTSTAAYSVQPAPNVGTLFVRATNLGAAAGDRGVLVLPTNPTQTGGLIPSMVGATSATAADATDFLTTQTIVNAAPNSNQFSVVPFSAYTAGVGALGAGAAANTFDVTGAATFAGASAANALRIQAGGGVDLGGGTMTLAAGNILTTGGANTGITNGTLNYAAGVTARFSVASGSDLTVSVPIIGTTGGLNKLGGGTLTLNNPVTSTTGLIGISAGTLKLGGVGILPIASTPFINTGATLDLNNNNTTLGGLVGWGDTNLGTGSLTIDSTTSPILAYGGGFVGSGALIKQNTNTQILAGNSPSFTGDVRVLGGGLTVNSTGALGTGTTPILLGNTTGTVPSTLTLGAAVNSFSRDITVQAGSTPATAHTLTLGSGINAISSNIAINNTSASSTSGGFTGTGIGLRLSGTSGAAAGTNTYSGTISGAGGLLIFGGNNVLSGNNTYSGGTMVDTVTTAWLGAGSNAAFGTGAVSFTTGFGANLRAEGGARTLANQINLSSTGGYFGVAGTNDLTLNGAFDLQGAAVAQTLNIMSAGTTTIGGVIQNGTGGIVKNGVGTLNLTGNNTYTGPTVLNAGTTLANNTAGNALTATTVNAGAILGGSGSIGGNLTVATGGIVAPGNSPGILTVNGSATFSAGSNLETELNGTTAGTGYDQLAVNGAVDLGNANLLLSLGYAPATSDFFYLVNNDAADAVTGTFSGLVQGGNVFASFGGGSYMGTISYTGDSNTTNFLGAGNDVVLFGFTAVPEPGTLALLGLGALGLVPMLRRRKR